MKTKILNLLTILMICVFAFGACKVTPSRLGTTAVGNPNPSITGSNAIGLEKIDEEGSSTITIPLAVFGDVVDNARTSTIKITYNGRLISEINSGDFYQEKTQFVVFTLKPLNDGDTLSFEVVLPDGSSTTYSGVVSTTKDQLAEPPLPEIIVTGDPEAPDSSNGTSRVIAGVTLSFAVFENGDLWGWGGNLTKGLGVETSDEKQSTPLKLDSITEVKDLSVGYFTLALKNNNSVWVWGFPSWLGDGTMPSNPTELTAVQNMVAVAAGHYHGVGLDSSGQVWVAGDNDLGQKGQGTHDADDTEPLTMIPVLVPGMSDVAKIFAGADASVAIKKDGTVWSWGSFFDIAVDGYVPAPVFQDSPTEITGLKDSTSCAINNLSIFCIKADKTVWEYQPGSATYTTPDGENWEYKAGSLKQVSGLTDAIQIAAGFHHGIILKADKTVWTFGRNFGGVLGNGAAESPDDAGTVPVTSLATGVTHVSTLSNALSVAAGLNHNLVMTGDGKVWSWGDNEYGQLGHGSAGISAHSPIEVQGF